jgi:PAS domain S-box-containing protein
MSSIGDASRDVWFPVGEAEGLAWFWGVCEETFPAKAREARDHLRKQVEHERGGDADVDVVSAIFLNDDDRLLQEVRRGIAGDFGPLMQSLRAIGGRWSRANVRLGLWHEAAERFRSSMVKALLRAYGQDMRRLEGSLNALGRLLDRAAAIIAEEYLEQRERMLREQRQQAEQAVVRFSRLFESGLLGILVCDLQGNAKEANESFLSMVGYTQEEMQSGEMSWAEMTPPEWQQLDQEAVAQLKLYGRTRTWEKEYIRKDGSRVPILVGVAMLNDVDCVAFVLDITERKRLEELRVKSNELEIQNRRIREASRLKSEFLANMSHELRTPLNAIIGFADLLHDGEVRPDMPQYRDFVGDILRSGKHLLQLINDVLDLAKVESGKMEFRPEPVELGKLVHEVCAVLRTVAADKRIRLECYVDAALADITADPSRLKQVLYNYASNALKFTEMEGSVIIEARPEREDSYRIQVIDTGIGIHPADLDRLFVEFQQLDAGISKKHAGTGLGLALTKRIVEAQGGHVGVESEPGKGSTFFAVLPRKAAVISEHERPSFRPETREGAATILIVDDDARDRQFIAQVIAGAGYGIETAGTGRQAIECCRQRLFDAVTLDLLLPDLTGLDVLRQIRNEGKNRDTPVIVVSVVAERGVVAGFPVHDYLAKPLRATDLLESLQRAGVAPQTSGTVMVVDDDPSSLKLMDAALAKLGYQVVCCPDGASALHMAEVQRPLAIVLDLMMPGVDGFEFLARFRGQPANCAVPVIVWTMKDLSVADHASLQRLAEAVFSKGQGRPLALLDELARLLAPRAAKLLEG